ncbi:MAG: hypothetical protein KAH97_05830 [Anaerolineales bacterium]|nr:hypothetical protein [Anaerolineales bacterium]
MQKPLSMYLVAEYRRKDLLKEAEMNRMHQVWLKGHSTSSGLKLNIALIGALIAAVLVSLGM